jgi:uncharacterized membrane protein YkvA (DUF1232 family)
VKIVQALKQKAANLRTETYTLYLASRDPRVPWYAKAFMVAVVGYALSPIDLIPDFIPVVGYLDDLIIVPAGVVIALRMIPEDVLEDCRARVEREGISSRAKWVAAAVITLVWLFALYLLLRFLFGLFAR